MKCFRLHDDLKNINISQNDTEAMCIVFDIDDTLYKENTDLVSKRRLAGYEVLKDSLKMDFNEFQRLSALYTNQYGTNYKGFILHHNISGNLIQKLNGISVSLQEHFDKPDETIKMLEELPMTKYAFSNSNIEQSKAVLKELGCDKFINTLFCASYEEGQECICKPQVISFKIVDEVINKKKNKKVFFFDDNSDNIKAAESIGWISTKVDNPYKIRELVNSVINKNK